MCFSRNSHKLLLRVEKVIAAPTPRHMCAHCHGKAEHRRPGTSLQLGSPRCPLQGSKSRLVCVQAALSVPPALAQCEEKCWDVELCSAPCPAPVPLGCLVPFPSSPRPQLGASWGHQ